MPVIGQIATSSVVAKAGSERRVADRTSLPLVVDLDGTLIKTDSLVESLVASLLRKPLSIFSTALALMRGRWAMKSRLAELGLSRAETIPVREDLLAYLKAEKDAGREIHLASAADQSVANTIAERIGIFTSAEGSKDGVNLKGEHKLARLKARFPGGFAYAGNGRSDLHVWKEASSVILVAASRTTRRAALQLGAPIEREFPGEDISLAEWLRAIRLHQWAKNLLLFVPLVLGHRVADAEALLSVTLGFIAMGLVASGTYLLNDLSDLEADRIHETKRNRPIASGIIGAGTALVTAAVLIGAGLVGAVVLSVPFAGLIALYIAMTTAYSLYFKKVPMFDVFVLGTLYTLRLFMGMVLVDAPPSPWLLVFALFFFFSLSMAKRHVEIIKAAHVLPADELIKGRGYKPSDAPLTLVFGVAANLAAILILFLYIVNDAYPVDAYRNPGWLWLIGFFVFLWSSRIWLLSHRAELDDDPVAFAIKDPVSWLLGLLVLGLFALAVL